MQAQDEQIKSSWSEVLNQYQRRADLIPNLVSTVKGYAAQEQQVLLGVTQARAKVGSIKATPELINDPAAFAKFQAAQSELSSALSRLLVVSENYPQLKSDQNFRDLQAQLEGTENRITVARNRYIDAVRTYNTTVRSFPSNLTAMMFGYKPKENFTVENEAVISKPPTVDFSAQPAPASPPHPVVIRLACLRRVPALLAACLFALAASGQVAVPPLTARVTDLTGTLSGAAVQRIEAKLGDLEAKKGSQIAVLILPTTQPEEIEQFGIRVMDQWKVGRKGVDDGAILSLPRTIGACASRSAMVWRVRCPTRSRSASSTRRLRRCSSKVTSTAASRPASIALSRSSTASRCRRPTSNGSAAAAAVTYCRFCSSSR